MAVFLLFFVVVVLFFVGKVLKVAKYSFIYFWKTYFVLVSIAEEARSENK